MADPILPIVHLNGTSRAALIDQRVEAGRAVREALDKLHEMAPNGRDYFLKPGLFEQARAQHERRAAALRALFNEIEAEYLALDDDLEGEVR